MTTETELTMNMDEIEVAKFEPVDEGDYNVTVESVDLRDGPNGKYWNLQLNITDEGKFKGWKLWYMMSFAQKALPFTKRTLVAVAPDVAQGVLNLDEGRQQLVGRALIARVKIEDWTDPATDEVVKQSRVKGLKAQS